MDELIKEIVNEEINKLIEESFKTPKSNCLTLGRGAISKKRRYAKELWAIIEKNYSSIGGCKSFEDNNGDGGFNDFVTGNYVWKIYFDRNKRPIGVNVYRPTRIGRKLICMASKEKYAFDHLMNGDLKRGSGVYGEVSGKPEHLLRKNPNVYWIDKNRVQGIFDSEGGWKRLVDLSQNDDIDKEERIPYNYNTHYYRKIGVDNNAKTFRKAMFGHPNIPNYQNTNRYTN